MFLLSAFTFCCKFLPSLTSHGLPVYSYDRTSRGAVAYEALAREIIEKEGS